MSYNIFQILFNIYEMSYNIYEMSCNIYEMSYNIYQMSYNIYRRTYVLYDKIGIKSILIHRKWQFYNLSSTADRHMRPLTFLYKI